MNIRFFLLAFLILTLLLGCVSARRIQRSIIAEKAKQELIGMSKTDILSCAGNPLRSEKKDQYEDLIYIGSSRSVDQNGNVPGEARYCEVTFTFSNDKVTDISYAGRTGGKDTVDEQCAFVVRNCLPKEKK